APARRQRPPRCTSPKTKTERNTTDRYRPTPILLFLQECPAKSGGVFVILADFPPFVKTGTYRYAPLLPGRTGRRGALSFFRIERQTPGAAPGASPWGAWPAGCTAGRTRPPPGRGGTPPAPPSQGVGALGQVGPCNTRQVVAGTAHVHSGIAGRVDGDSSLRRWCNRGTPTPCTNVDR